MKLTDLGEQGLIERIRRRVGQKSADIEVGIGDDACAVKAYSGLLTLVTTDAFVEGNHFDLSYFSFKDVGTKAIAASISDIGAMGGVPRYCVVSLLSPGNVSAADVDSLIDGLLESCERFGAELVGGDIVGAPYLALSCTFIGEVEKENMVLRSGARPGDNVFVTGDLGASEAGRLVLSKKMSVQPDVRAYVTTRHKSPSPRLKESRELVLNHRIHSMIDISDGLSIDANHIADESGVKLRIDAGTIPISAHVHNVAGAASIPALDIALYGGEDFELLFTASALEVKNLGGVPVTMIGEVVEGKGVFIISPDGTESPLQPKGYKHF
jgi:thiamine-monophosphate kinase